MYYLTIAIPTYNRKEPLINTLNKLLPQLNDNCFLLIIDNHSDVFVSDYAIDLIEKHAQVNYELIRNRVNVGGNCNILRCFEYCKTDWLWVLGDDDELLPNAVETILFDITKYPEALNINYYSPNVIHPLRTKTTISYGRGQFVESIDSFGAAIFISTNIYNSKLIGNDMMLANHYAYTCVPQFLAVFFASQEDTITVNSHEIICVNGSDDRIYKYSNYNLLIAKGFASILEIPTDKEIKNILLARLRETTHYWLTIDGIIKTLLVEYFKSNRRLDIAFAFKQHYLHFYKLLGIKNKMKFYFYFSILLFSPRVLFKIINFLYRRYKGIELTIPNE
ncbi:MAG: hypothetical protein JWQ34_531 [Mucilaginibacter sp.]|uniref:glycosyltransferase family 2 protein n=1 Tax=Mucilaginibacter sp. TaxID=1882438 RepID=UPI002606CD01|nr:glycosyltransferase [Mucilaginibacter sp.]MDB5002306.1 hypothetical protein [Mucilaginibacter sp.]